MFPLILDARGRSSHLRIYPYFFDIYLCIFSGNSVGGWPPAGCPGPSHPPKPPLHATSVCVCVRACVYLFRCVCMCLILCEYNVCNGFRRQPLCTNDCLQPSGDPVAVSAS